MRMMLDTATPMCICLGRDDLLYFLNDAYIPIVADKYPLDLPMSQWFEPRMFTIFSVLAFPPQERRRLRRFERRRARCVRAQSGGLHGAHDRRGPLPALGLPRRRALTFARAHTPSFWRCVHDANTRAIMVDTAP
jgi:hypothetical protein